MPEPNARASRSLRLLSALLAASFLGAPVTAFAQTGNDAEASAAREDAAQDDAEARAAHFYQEAAEAYNRGEFARAADLLERAYAHQNNPIYIYNRILAYQGMNKPGEALRILEEHAEELQSDSRFSDLPDLRAELTDAIAARDAQAQDASQASDTIEPSDNEAPTIETPPQVEDAPNILAWSLIGAGGVALGAGALFGSGLLISDTTERLESSRTSEAEQSVYGGTSHTREADLSRLRTHQTLNVVLMAGGVSLGVAGATMLFLDARADRQHPRALRFEPLLSGDLAGARLRGRF